MSDIHPTAVIYDNASIGDNVQIGPYCIVGSDVGLSDGAVLEADIVVNGHTKIGANTKIFPYASIGLPPQDMKYKGWTALQEGRRKQTKPACPTRKPTTPSVSSLDLWSPSWPI